VSKSRIDTTVAVIGAGPSGSSAAYWLSLRGIDTVVLEKKHFPREKACGDGLTPRSVVQLESMGLSNFLSKKHRYLGLRANAYGKSLEIPWPSSPEYPSHGYVVTRYELDKAVAERAEALGAKVYQGFEVTGAALSSDKAIDFISATDERDGSVFEVHAKYYVLAEGANSRVARSIGAVRNRNEPMGMAVRAYFETDRSEEPWIESQMDLRNDDGDIIPGYGWIFPLGDGRANIGFGLLTNSHRWRSINTTKALESYVRQIGPSWGIDPKSAHSKFIGGKLQMGHVVTPRAGNNYLLVGDSAASINPFNGEGIAYALETGKVAADVVTLAIGSPSIDLAKVYTSRLEERYGEYYSIARAFVKLISEPRIMAPAIWLATREQRLMTPIVTVMANLMSAQDPRLGDHLYSYADKALKVLKAVQRSKEVFYPTIP